MWKLFYNIVLSAYKAGISVAAGTNVKANKWIRGRKNIWLHMEEQLPPAGKRVWMHCSSLGEFEQGRSIIDALKRDYPNIQIILTFFSPSGYEVRKNYGLADAVFYLPLDGAANAKKFVERLNPQFAIFIKSDYWFYYFRELKRRKIPLLLVSAVIRKDQPFFKFYGKLHKEMLQYVTWFFVQDNMSGKLLEKLGFGNYSVINDTRVDRVAALANESNEIPDIKEWLNGKRLLIAGSVYQKEIELIAEQRDALLKDWKVIIAPPDVDPQTIRNIMWRFKQEAITFSEFDPVAHGEKQILVLDNVGMLNKLYRYADIAVIGGGFFKSIHNILEPASFGVPVIFGPKHQKFREAVELVASDVAFCVYNSGTFTSALKKLVNDEEFYESASKAAATYIQMNRGGTEKVMQHIKQYYLTLEHSL